MATNKTTGTLLFRIAADTKALRRGMSETKRSIDKLKNTFRGMAGAVGVAFSAQAVIGFTKEIIKLSGEAQGVREAFLRIGDEQMLQGLRDATKGTVSDLRLMQKAVEADNFQIPLETLASLFEFAARRAQQTGQSVDYLVNSIVLGIGRKSPLILDNLGISAVRLRQELEGAGVEMNTVGDIAAAVSRIAQEEMKKAGGVIESTKIETERLGATWENIKEQLGQVVIQQTSLNEILSSFNEVLDKLNQPGKIQNLVEDFKKVYNYAYGMMMPLISLLQQANKLRKNAKSKSTESQAEDAMYYWANKYTGYGSSKPAPGGGGGGNQATQSAPSNLAMGATPVGNSFMDPITDKENNIIQLDVSGLVNISSELERMSPIIEKVKEQVIDLSEVFQQTFMSAVDAFAGSVENLVASGKFMENGFASVLGGVGKFMVQMGKMLIAWGIAQEAFQAALANIFNPASPGIVIAAGAAMVVIGSIMSGYAAHMVGSGGGGGGTAVRTWAGHSQAPGGQTIQVEGVLKGSDIYLSQQNYMNGINRL